MRDLMCRGKPQCGQPGQLPRLQKRISLFWQCIRKKFHAGVARDRHATLGPPPGGSESGKKKLWAAFGRALLGQTGSTETGRPDAYLMPSAKEGKAAMAMPEPDITLSS